MTSTPALTEEDIQSADLLCAHLWSADPWTASVTPLDESRGQFIWFSGPGDTPLSCMFSGGCWVVETVSSEDDPRTLGVGRTAAQAIHAAINHITTEREQRIWRSTSDAAKTARSRPRSGISTSQSDRQEPRARLRAV